MRFVPGSVSEKRPRRDVQSRQLSLFSYGEGSLAEEPGLVSQGGDAVRAAGKGRSPREGVRGAPRERAVGQPAGVELLWPGNPQRAGMMSGEGLNRPPLERKLLTDQTLLGACQPSLGLPAGGYLGTTARTCAGICLMEGRSVPPIRPWSRTPSRIPGTVGFCGIGAGTARDYRCMLPFILPSLNIN